MATLYIVATPIGNLEDVSRRTLRILTEADLILCEDTRVTKKLLEHYGIKTPTLSYHQHSKLQKVDYIINLLRQDKKIALVSDAGTPGISDPGNKLVEEAVRSLGDKINVVPIPGPSALAASASVSGFPIDKFLFLGFPPLKKRRKKFFEEVVVAKYPVIFYESPYRIMKSLRDLELEAKSQNMDPQVVVCRELTKKFETIYRGKLKEALEEIEGGEIRGEFTVIVGKERG